MKIPSGHTYLAQEMNLLNNDDLLGCFLNKKLFAIHWFHEEIASQKIGYNYQTEYCEPAYTVEYPLLCFTGPFPDRSEIRIVNLSDKSAPRISLQLENMQVESFV